MLIVSPLVSLVDSTKQAIVNLGISSVAWKDYTPAQFVHQNSVSPVVVSICSPEHLLSLLEIDYLFSWEPALETERNRKGCC